MVKRGHSVRAAPPAISEVLTQPLGFGTRLGEGYDPRQVLDAMLLAYDELPDDIGEAYRSALVTLGQSVRVVLTDSEVVGRALDVLPDGRLVVLDDCGITHRFDTGDIVHLR